jgi:peptide/nickel transport system permease protein
LITFTVRRLLLLFLTLVIASFVIFGAMQLVPGDPILAMFFPRIPSEEVYQNLERELGLDKPFLMQYVGYMSRLVLHGDLGESFKRMRTVREVIVQNLGATASLALGGILVSVLVGIPLGVISAIVERKWIDTVVMVIALIGVSTPSFWLGILLILVFSLGLGWFPTSGIGGIDRLVLPSLTLGLYGAGYLARFARSSVLEVKHQDYVTTARSKGISETRVNLKHVLRNALIPIVTMSGLLAGYMLGGAVIVETVFGRPGLGHVLVSAISQKDFPLVQGVLIFVVAVFSLVNLLVDLSYAYIDPRVKY